jgi:hypothetical protein
VKDPDQHLIQAHSRCFAAISFSSAREVTLCLTTPAYSGFAAAVGRLLLVASLAAQRTKAALRLPPPFGAAAYRLVRRML